MNTYHFKFNLGTLEVNEQELPVHAVMITGNFMLTELSIDAQFMEGWLQSPSQFDAMTTVMQYCESVFVKTSINPASINSNQNDAAGLALTFDSLLEVFDELAQLHHNITDESEIDCYEIHRTMTLSDAVEFVNNDPVKMIAKLTAQLDLSVEHLSVIWVDLFSELNKYEFPFTKNILRAAFAFGITRWFEGVEYGYTANDEFEITIKIY